MQHHLDMTGVVWLGLGLFSSTSLTVFSFLFWTQIVWDIYHSLFLLKIAFVCTSVRFLVEGFFLHHGYAYHRIKPKRHIGWVAKTAADVIVVAGTVVVRVLLYDLAFFGIVAFPFLTTLLQVYWQLYWPTSDLSLLDVSLRGLMQVVIYCVMGTNYEGLSMVLVLSGCVIFYRYWFYSAHVTVVTDEIRNGDISRYV